MHYVTHRSHQMWKHKFGITWPGMLSWKPYRSQASMKSSASTFRGPDTPKCTTWPAYPTKWKNTNLASHIPARFCGIWTGPTWAWKIVPRHFVARMHQNAACDTQIPPDAKTLFGVTCLGVCFVESVLVPPKYEKYYINVSRPGLTGMHFVTLTGGKNTSLATRIPSFFLGKPHRAHLSMKNSALVFHAPDTPECTTWSVDATGCENTSSAYRVPLCFLWKLHRAHLTMKNSTSTFHTMESWECTTWPTDPTGCKNTSSA
jgi:hypothetical protein